MLPILLAGRDAIKSSYGIYTFKLLNAEKREEKILSFYAY